MSLEEFLGDDSLGDSVWNEDDINLDAINNTTNIDVLKNARPQDSSNYGRNDRIHSNDTPQMNNHFGQEFNRSSSLRHEENYRPIIHSRSNTDHYGSSHQPQFEHPQPQPPIIQGPPYIIKFSNLPPNFANFDIEELFEAKYTKFVKFKIFWEINKNPSLSTLKSGSIFDQNFKRDKKVAFVELFSGRDIMKILKYWSQPLRDIYKIDIQPAQFEDFKDYMSKIDLLKDPKDDPSLPYIAPKPKTNPFGTAKPVDTQSKTLDIEEKMEQLHVEDTETLRRLSQGEPLETLKPKIKILKKPQLSYSEVAQHSIMENVKKNGAPGTYSNKIAISPPPTLASLNATSYEHETRDEKNDNLGENDDTNENIDNSKLQKENDTVEFEDNQHEADKSTASDEDEPRYEENAIADDDEDSDNETPKTFTFKNQERETSPNSLSSNYNKSYRGGRGTYNRGGYNRGGRGGNYSRGSGRGGRGGRGDYKQRSNSHNYNKNSPFQKENPEGKDNSPSLFAPASGFLQDKTKSDRSSHGGNSSGRGRGRGRGRGGYRRGRGNYRGGFE